MPIRFSPVPEYRVFISSPRDVAAERARALRVIERLNGEFRDQLRLAPVAWEEKVYQAAKDFQEQIDLASECQLVVGIFWARTGTPLDPGRYHRPDGRPYESGTVFEVETALDHARQDGVPDVVLFHKDVDPPLEREADPEQQVAQLRLLSAILRRWVQTERGAFKGAFNHFHSTDEFASQLEQFLRDWLANRGHGVTGPVWRVESDADSPFPGLQSYESRHECVFFGRSAERERCRELLAEAAARGCASLLILGASGAGKSSLARAGLLPRLALPGSAPGVDGWRVAAFRPGAAPLVALATALFDPGALPELTGSDAPTPSEWADMVAARAEGAASSVCAALRRSGTSADGETRTMRLLLLVDQLEDLFNAGAAEQGSFAKAVLTLARSGCAWVIATMRADRYAGLQGEAALLALRQEGAVYDLLLPGPAEFDQIVRGPVRAAGLTFERRRIEGRDLGDVLLADVAGADTLPLLQMALAQLFAKRDRTAAGAGMLTFAAYDTLGGLAGAIRQHAEQVFSGVDGEAKRELPALLLDLAGGVTGTGQVASRPVRLYDSAAFPARMRLLDALIEGRLLVAERRVTDRAAQGPEQASVWVRVAHDALLRNWPRAAEVLAPERVQVKTRLERLQSDWEAEGRPRSLLLRRGRNLDAAADLRRVLGAALTPSLTDFIARSLQADRIRRWLVPTGMVLAVSLVAAACLTYWYQMKEAEFRVAELANEKIEAKRQREQARENLVLGVDAAGRVVFAMISAARNAPGFSAEAMGSSRTAIVQVIDELVERSKPEYQPTLIQFKAFTLVEFAAVYAARGDYVHQGEAAAAACEFAWASVKRDLRNAQRQQERAATYDSDGDAKRARGDLDRALQDYRSSLNIRECRAEQEPADPDRQCDVVTSLEKVGAALADMNDPGAPAHALRARDYTRRWASSFPPRCRDLSARVDALVSRTGGAD